MLGFILPDTLMMEQELKVENAGFNFKELNIVLC